MKSRRNRTLTAATMTFCIAALYTPATIVAGDVQLRAFENCMPLFTRDYIAFSACVQRTGQAGGAAAGNSAPAQAVKSVVKVCNTISRADKSAASR